MAFPTYPLPTTTFATLKALDADTTRAFVAQAAMAFGWQPDGVALLCKLTGAPVDEVNRIIRAARAAKDYANGASSDANALQPGYVT